MPLPAATAVQRNGPHVLVGVGLVVYGLVVLFARGRPRWIAAGSALFGSTLLIGGVIMWRRLGKVEIPSGRRPGPELGRSSGGESLEESYDRVRSAKLTKQLVKAPSLEDRIEILRKLAREGSEDVEVREMALAVLSRVCGTGRDRRWCVPEKDWEGEIKALFSAFKDPSSPIGVRYVRDGLLKDQYTNVSKTLRAKSGDCLPGETLLLTPKGFKQIVDVRIGDVVMGAGWWVKVTNWWDKGVLPVREIDLSSGSTLRCTDEHRLFVVPRGQRSKIGGWCPVGDRGTEVECDASAVEEGEDLLTPERIVLGERSLSPDDAWLLGAFIADGWVGYDERGYPRNASLSGKDGHPKEEQKRRAQRIAHEKGWETRWNSRYLAMKPDQTWMELFVSCGRGALNKKLPFVDVDVPTAANLLEGLSADASKNSHGGGLTYGTISPMLALQVRLLFRALGYKTSIRRVDDHGGLGKNPIYRIGVTGQDTKDGRKVSSFVKVREVRAPVEDAHVFDIEVEGQRFYLPEHDIVVHNCDDMSSAFAALCMSVGYSAKLVPVSAVGAGGSASHILPKIGIPPGPPERVTKWIAADATVNKPLGWFPPSSVIEKQWEFDI